MSGAASASAPERPPGVSASVCVRVCVRVRPCARVTVWMCARVTVRAIGCDCSCDCMSILVIMRVWLIV